MSESRDTQLTVPHAMLAAYGSTWPSDAQVMLVADKKELFYRMMLPLIMHGNVMVVAERAKLDSYRAQLTGGKSLSAESLADLGELVPLLRITDTESAACAPHSGRRANPCLPWFWPMAWFAIQNVARNTWTR